MTTPAPTLDTIPVAQAARWAYFGTLAPNGYWYFAPVANFPGSVLKVDPADGSTTFIAGPVDFSVPGTSNGYSAVLDGNGRIYCAPDELAHDSVLVIDTNTDTVSTISVGLSFGGQFSSGGGVYQPGNGAQGAVFFPVSRFIAEGDVVKIDCATQTATVIDTGTSVGVWSRAALVGDTMYACESRFWTFNGAEQRVLRFNTLTETADAVNAGIGTNTDGYWPIELPGNRLMWVAGSTGDGFIVDVDTFTYEATVGHAGIPSADGAVAPNGDVYLVSNSTGGIYRINSTTGVGTLIDTGGLYPYWSLGFIGNLFYAYDESNGRVIQVDTTDDTVTSTPVPPAVVGTFDTYTTLVPDTDTAGRAYLIPDASFGNETTSIITLDATVVENYPVDLSCTTQVLYWEEAPGTFNVTPVQPDGMDIGWTATRLPGGGVRFTWSRTWLVDDPTVDGIVFAGLTVSDDGGIPEPDPSQIGPFSTDAIVATATGASFSDATPPGSPAGLYAYSLDGPPGVTAGDVWTVEFTVTGPYEVAIGEVVTGTLTEVTEDPGFGFFSAQFSLAWTAMDCGAVTIPVYGDCSLCADPTPAVIEGQLGVCGLAKYQVDLMARGGDVRIDTFESVIDVRWERRLDAIASASIEVAKRNDRCCAQIEAADPYATELCIRRDGVIVFEGPVYEVGESRDTAVILARDVSHWLERRIVRSSIDDSVVPPDSPVGTEPGRDGSLIARDIIRAGFQFDDPNVLDWLYVVEGADITARKTDAEQRPYAFTELSDIARTSIDWTVAGRRMFVMPAQHPLGVLSRINDDDIVGDYTITKMGRDYASRQITVGQGALRSVAGGKSARYGLVEQVNQEQSLTTQEAVDNAANVQYRVTPRPPIWVSLDNGVALRPTAPVTIDELIPGVVFPGHFTQRCQTIQQDFRLQAVSVEFTEGVEQVSIDAVAVGYAFESPDAAYQTGIVIGDSLTALNASLQNTRGGRWADRIEDSGYVADLRVFAIPGATSQTMIDAPLVEPQRSDLFIVFFGANDMNTGIPELMADEITPAEFADNIAWYLTNYPAARQVVVFPWRWTGFPVPGGPVDESTYQAYRVAAITTANRFGAAFVDMGTNTATPEPYIVDWIHANRRGHERIASMVRAVL